MRLRPLHIAHTSVLTIACNRPTGGFLCRVRKLNRSFTIAVLELVRPMFPSSHDTSVDHSGALDDFFDLDRELTIFFVPP